MMKGSVGVANDDEDDEKSQWYRRRRVSNGWSSIRR